MAAISQSSPVEVLLEADSSHQTYPGQESKVLTLSEGQHISIKVRVPRSALPGRGSEKQHTCLNVAVFVDGVKVGGFCFEKSKAQREKILESSLSAGLVFEKFSGTWKSLNVIRFVKTGDVLCGDSTPIVGARDELLGTLTIVVRESMHNECDYAYEEHDTGRVNGRIDETIPNFKTQQLVMDVEDGEVISKPSLKGCKPIPKASVIAQASWAIRPDDQFVVPTARPAPRPTPPATQIKTSKPSEQAPPARAQSGEIEFLKEKEVTPKAAAFINLDDIESKPASPENVHQTIEDGDEASGQSSADVNESNISGSVSDQESNDSEPDIDIKLHKCKFNRALNNVKAHEQIVATFHRERTALQALITSRSDANKSQELLVAITKRKRQDPSANFRDLAEAMDRMETPTAHAVKQNEAGRDEPPAKKVKKEKTKVGKKVVEQKVEGRAGAELVMTVGAQTGATGGRGRGRGRGRGQGRGQGRGRKGGRGGN